MKTRRRLQALLTLQIPVDSAEPRSPARDYSIAVGGHTSYVGWGERCELNVINLGRRGHLLKYGAIH